VGRQWQLQQDAVDILVGVEAVDQVGKRLLSCLAGQVEGLGEKAHLLAILALVGHVDLGSGVGAHQYHRQARCAQPLLATLGDTLSDLLAQAGGDSLAVDKLCSHDA
jgi:hypothetical protein